MTGFRVRNHLIAGRNTKYLSCNCTIKRRFILMVCNLFEIYSVKKKIWFFKFLCCVNQLKHLPAQTHLCVVYFDQCLGAGHFNCRSKSHLYVFCTCSFWVDVLGYIWLSAILDYFLGLKSDMVVAQFQDMTDLKDYRQTGLMFIQLITK